MLRRFWLLLFVLSLLLPVGGPSLASAEVSHGSGFSGVVDGFRSWYGSYRLAGVGVGWCVDHGIPAPDAALGYERVRVGAADGAVAWAVGRWGGVVDGDRVGAAALLLAVHDLMGAVYPSGPLSVESLSPAAMSGFDGMASAVLDRARVIRADAVAHGSLVAPLTIEVAVEAPAPAFVGREGRLTARVLDAAGVGVDGVVVHPAVTGAALLTEVDVTTDGSGVARWSFEVGPGANEFEVSAEVPVLEADAFAPSRAVAQRVVRPARQVLTGRAAIEGVVARRFTIAKRGDAEPRLPVGGARFRLDGPVGAEVTTGAGGLTPPVEVAPGTYTVTEFEPPAGYGAAGPWVVEVGATDVTLEVVNVARRGRLRIEKVDAVTGAVVTGAQFSVTDERGEAVPDSSAPLLPGRYAVREVEPPPGYRPTVDALSVDVVADEEAVVRVVNQPLASIAFEKHPPLAGARFEVHPADAPGVGVGACTTGPDGRCSLPPLSLDAGRRYCWEETEAPPGWAPAPAACIDLTGAGSVATVVVDEPPAPPPPRPEVSAIPPHVDAPPATPVVFTTVPGKPPPLPPPPPELPATGAGHTRALASLGTALVGVGLLLLSRRPRR